MFVDTRSCSLLLFDAICSHSCHCYVLRYDVSHLIRYIVHSTFYDTLFRCRVTLPHSRYAHVFRCLPRTLLRLRSFPRVYAIDRCSAVATHVDLPRLLPAFYVAVYASAFVTLLHTTPCVAAVTPALPAVLHTLFVTSILFVYTRRF